MAGIILPPFSIDEVYQAAMQSEQGGIRYNDTTKTVQLMDVNKNWVDWKVYDAHAQLELCGLSAFAISPSMNYTFTHNGVYIFVTTTFSSTGFTQTTNASQIFSQSIASESGRSMFIRAFDAVIGDTISISCGANASNVYSSIALYYIGSGISNLTVVNAQARSEGNTISLTASSKDSIVFGHSSSKNTTGSDSTISMNSSGGTRTTNGNYYACWTNLYDSGTCTITARSGYGTAGIACLQVAKI